MLEHVNVYHIVLVVLGTMAAVLVLMLLYLAVIRPKQLFLGFLDHQLQSIRKDFTIFSDTYHWVRKRNNKATSKRKPKKKERLRFQRKSNP